MPDERSRDAELDEHSRRDLAGERTLVGPVDVLRVDRPFLADRGLERDERRAEHDLDAVGRLELVEEGERLDRALEHLPVACHQRGHQASSGIAATPGSSRPSSSSSDAPPPVETQEIRSARPSSWIARTESPPPTTE